MTVPQTPLYVHVAVGEPVYPLSQEAVQLSPPFVTDPQEKLPLSGMGGLPEHTAAATKPPTCLSPGASAWKQSTAIFGNAEVANH